jgi:hypothetical protein
LPRSAGADNASRVEQPTVETLDVEMIGLFAAVIIYAAAPAMTAPAGTAAPVAQTAPKDAALAEAKADDKVVCHSEGVSGTRFRKRVCMTTHDAADRRLNSRDDLRQIQEGAQSYNPNK